MTPARPTAPTPHVRQGAAQAPGEEASMRTTRRPTHRRPVPRVPLLVLVLLLGAALAQERLDPGPGGPGPTLPPTPFALRVLDEPVPTVPYLGGGIPFAEMRDLRRLARERTLPKPLIAWTDEISAAERRDLRREAIARRPGPPVVLAGMSPSEMRELRQLARRRTLPAPVLADTGAKSLSEGTLGLRIRPPVISAVASDASLLRAVLLLGPDGSGSNGIPGPRDGDEVPFR